MYIDLKISLELVAIDKIVAASSHGEHLLPNRGKIKDPNREKHHPEPSNFEFLEMQELHKIALSYESKRLPSNMRTAFFVAIQLRLNLRMETITDKNKKTYVRGSRCKSNTDQNKMKIPEIPEIIDVQIFGSQS